MMPLSSVQDSTGVYFATFMPTGAVQALSGAGAISLTSYLTDWTTTGANAGTLANGVIAGQLKEVRMVTDGGDGTLTPATPTGFATVTFNDVNDVCLFMWTGSAWRILKNTGCTVA